MTDLQRRCAADNNILIQGDKLLVNGHPLMVGSQVILKNTATQDTHKYVIHTLFFIIFIFIHFRVTIATISHNKVYYYYFCAFVNSNLFCHRLR